MRLTFIAVLPQQWLKGKKLLRPGNTRLFVSPIRGAKHAALYGPTGRVPNARRTADHRLLIRQLNSSGPSARPGCQFHPQRRSSGTEA